MTAYTSRQLEIIAAAIHLIAEGGIQNLTIKNIAREIGVTEPAIYRHFAHKIDILIGIVEQFRLATISPLAALQTGPQPPAEQIASFIRQMTQRFKEHPALASIIFSEELFQNDSALAGKIYSLMEEMHLRMADNLHSGQQTRVFRRDIAADHLASIIIGTLRLTIKRWHLSGYQSDIIADGTRIWASLSALIQVDR